MTATATAPARVMPDRPMLTRRETAALIGCSTRTVDRMCADRQRGFPQPYRFGSFTRWRRDEVMAWIERHRPTVDAHRSDVDGPCPP